VNLTNPEKLILTMLAEIHEALSIENGIDHKLLKEAIYSDNTWALTWEMPGIIGGGQKEQNPPEVDEVVEILGMWRFLEDSYDMLGPEDKKKVETEAKPFGSRVRFSGFDGNNEGRMMSIASFLVEEMGRFSRFKGRDMNSHGNPPLDAYRRMVDVFEPTVHADPLNAEQIIEILKAQTHPSYAAGS